MLNAVRIKIIKLIFLKIYLIFNIEFSHAKAFWNPKRFSIRSVTSSPKIKSRRLCSGWWKVSRAAAVTHAYFDSARVRTSPTCLGIVISVVFTCSLVPWPCWTWGCTRESDLLSVLRPHRPKPPANLYNTCGAWCTSWVKFFLRWRTTYGVVPNTTMRCSWSLVVSDLIQWFTTLRFALIIYEDFCYS